MKVKSKKQQKIKKIKNNFFIIIMKIFFLLIFKYLTEISFLERKMKEVSKNLTTGEDLLLHAVFGNLLGTYSGYKKYIER